jgi:hypothetical protein
MTYLPGAVFRAFDLTPNLLDITIRIVELTEFALKVFVGYHGLRSSEDERRMAVAYPDFRF